MVTPNTTPHLQLIAGTMFSGKSTELVRRINRYEVLGYQPQLFKPAIDNRYGEAYVASHDRLQRPAISVTDLADLVDKYDTSVDIIGIDEIQFLESGIIELCENAVRAGKIVVCAGLAKDFRDRYFPFKDQQQDMSELIRRADSVDFLTAFCTYKNGDARPCGNNASRVQRLVSGKVAPLDSPVVQVGGQEAYEPRCREHFVFYGV